MPDEVVFHPDRRGVRVRDVSLIAGGFFVFVQLFVLDDLVVRLAFAGAFVAFLLVGFWFSRRNAGSWPQEIVINRSGIGCGNLKAWHGLDWIPWTAVERMDLFHTDPRLPPHLRMGLRPGDVRDRVTRPRWHRLGMGFDVNIPVSVDATPEVVLQTAQAFWHEALSGRE
ncbi:MAG: hypothetical protein KDH20_17850 [Rhodocyclaceae bacterium]|nr:hypothetical protein [Rhodocyclaceae bacterium]